MGLGWLWVCGWLQRLYGEKFPAGHIGEGEGVRDFSVTHPPPPTFRYKEVVETVLRFKDSKEKQIRRAVIVLLPRLAAFSPERFAAEYAAKALSHLIR